MDKAVQRFACTQCGKCCDRAPEVLLSEAAALADVFLFRLMFRLYSLPRTLAEYRARSPGATAEAYYQKKRLLAAYSALRYEAGGKGGPDRYLMVSALPVDLGRGACGALKGTGCRIYARRPLSCRTVPFHYSRAEAVAAAGLRAFVATSGYECDVGEDAAIVLDGGRIVDTAALTARSEALALSERERAWKEAIVRAMKRAGSLPSLSEVEANAAFGATTAPMRAAWQIAVDAGLMAPDALDALDAAQRALIERELASGACTAEARTMLIAMRADYAARPPVTMCRGNAA